MTLRSPRGPRSSHRTPGSREHCRPDRAVGHGGSAAARLRRLRGDGGADHQHRRRHRPGRRLLQERVAARGCRHLGRHRGPGVRGVRRDPAAPHPGLLRHLHRHHARRRLQHGVCPPERLRGGSTERVDRLHRPADRLRRNHRELHRGAPALRGAAQRRLAVRHQRRLPLRVAHPGPHPHRLDLPRAAGRRARTARQHGGLPAVELDVLRAGGQRVAAPLDPVRHQGRPAGRGPLRGLPARQPGGVPAVELDVLHSRRPTGRC